MPLDKMGQVATVVLFGGKSKDGKEKSIAKDKATGEREHETLVLMNKEVDHTYGSL